MKLVEIGGGVYPRQGYTNVDMLTCADIVHNLNDAPWPIEDASVDEVYTSHCIEHVKCPFVFVREICRICKVGAKVEIRCPDSMSDMALCAGHEYTFSMSQVRHFAEFPAVWFNGDRKLTLVNQSWSSDPFFFNLARSNPIFNGWTDEDITLWIPRTRHENIFIFRVDNVNS